jgi:hypothetical protein
MYDFDIPGVYNVTRDENHTETGPSLHWNLNCTIQVNI